MTVVNYLIESCY